MRVRFGWIAPPRFADSFRGRGSAKSRFLQTIVVPSPHRRVTRALDSADGLQDLFRRTRFGQQSKGRVREGLFHQVPIGKTGVNDDGDFAPFFSDFLEGGR